MKWFSILLCAYVSRIFHKLPVGVSLLSFIWMLQFHWYGSCNYFYSLPIFSFPFSFSCGRFCWGIFLCLSSSSPSVLAPVLAPALAGFFVILIVDCFLNHHFRLNLSPAVQIFLLLHCLAVLWPAPAVFAAARMTSGRCLVTPPVVSRPYKSCFILGEMFKGMRHFLWDAE